MGATCHRQPQRDVLQTQTIKKESAPRLGVSHKVVPGVELGLVGSKPTVIPPTLYNLWMADDLCSAIKFKNIFVTCCSIFATSCVLPTLLSDG